MAEKYTFVLIKITEYTNKNFALCDVHKILIKNYAAKLGLGVTFLINCYIELRVKCWTASYRKRPIHKA